MAEPDDGNGNLLRLFGRWNSGKHRHRLFGPGDHDWGDGFIDGHRVTNGGGGRIRERVHADPPPGEPPAQPIIAPYEYAINALDMARDVIANWRMYHGNESTYGKCQWIDGWYWSFTYQGNENITTYYNATAAADASYMFTTNVNDPSIRPGDSLNWWYDVDGHIGTAIGWDGNRLLCVHTSNNCDVVMDLGNNYKVSHADTLNLAFRGASHTNGNNIERAGLVPYVIGSAPTPTPPARNLLEDDMPAFFAPNTIVWPNGFCNSYRDDVYAALYSYAHYPDSPDTQWVRDTYVRESWAAVNFIIDMTADEVERRQAGKSTGADAAAHAPAPSTATLASPPPE